MADEEKKITQATAKSVNEWVGGYYGTDAIDLSKANKVKHLVATGQFASVVYVVSKNTKLAHTDLSATAYTAIDTMYAKAAELIIRLLHRKYKNGGAPLTATDFEDCGGKDLFGGRSNYDQIVNDYIKDGGMVDTAQSVLPVYESDEANAECYGRIVNDMGDVKRDHSYLLSITGSKDGTLSREQIFNIFDSTTDKAIKIWQTLKDTKSGGDFELQKQFEEAFMLKYDLAKKTAKMGIVLGGATYALGAMAGGLIFVPALFALGSYALGKRWLPDWFKSLGGMWGSIEKRHETQRKINRATAHMDWIVRFVENGGKPPRKTWKDFLYVRKADEAVLKKQAKTVGLAGIIEGTDGKPHKGINQEAKEAAARGLGMLINNDSPLISVESADEIVKRIDRVAGKPLTFEELEQIAEIIDASSKNFPASEKHAVLRKYSGMLLNNAQALIFKNDFETGTDYQDKISKYLSEEKVILSILKDFDPNTVEKVKRFVTFASKELTGLDKTYIGGPLEDYIMRMPTPKMERTDFTLTDAGVVKFDLSAYSTMPYAPTIENVLDMISKMKLDPANQNEFIVEGSGRKIADITREIALIQVPPGSSAAELKDAEDARNACNSALNKQMAMIVYSKSRADSRGTYEAVMKGEYAGKLAFGDTFKKFGEVTYENVETFSAFYLDMAKTEPAEVRDYIRGKFAKQVYDIMKAYAGQNIEKFKSDLKSLSEYLKKVNNTPYLNQQQKMELSASVSGCVEKAFGNTISDLSDTFVQGYDTNFFADCLKSYEKGGFAELFASDQSADTQMLKAAFEYMRDMQDVYNSLKLGEQFDLNKDDAKYIAKTLLTDRTTGEPPALKARESGTDVQLVEFVRSNIKNMSTSFGTDVTTTNLATKQPHRDLVAALGVARSMPTANDFQKYDKYTALLILKNKCISLFRLCIKDFVQGNYTGSRSTWIDTNSPVIDAMKQAWENGIMRDIDDELNHPDLNGIKKSASGSTRSEIGKYGTGSEVEAMMAQRQI